MSSQYSVSNTYMNIVFLYSNVYITYGYRMFNHMIKYKFILIQEYHNKNVPQYIDITNGLGLGGGLGHHLTHK